MKHSKTHHITFACITGMLALSLTATAKLYPPKQSDQPVANRLINGLAETMIRIYDVKGSKPGLEQEEWSAAFNDFLQLLPPPPEHANRRGIQNNQDPREQRDDRGFAVQNRPDSTQIATHLMEHFDRDHDRVLSSEELQAIFQSNAQQRH